MAPAAIKLACGFPHPEVDFLARLSSYKTTASDSHKGLWYDMANAEKVTVDRGYFDALLRRSVHR